MEVVEKLGQWRFVEKKGAMHGGEIEKEQKRGKKKRAKKNVGATR